MPRQVFCHHCEALMTREEDAPPAYPPRRMIWVRRWSCPSAGCPDRGVVTAEGNCLNVSGDYIHKAR